MARCTDSGVTCACVVEGAGSVDVTGDGSPGNPYTVALAAAVATDLQVGDTVTVNLSLTGNGSPGTPYSITGDVIPGTVVPSTNGTMDLVGANLEPTLKYDTGTRKVGLNVSADDGNGVTTGTDGGMFVPAASWQYATVVAVAPILIELTGAGGTQYETVDMWSLDPGLGDSVIVLGPGGTAGGGTPAYLILEAL